MNVTEIADEVQDQLLSIVEIAQANVVGAVEAVCEQAQYLIPQYAVRFANRIPSAAHAVDRGFDRAEQWLQLQHRFTTKLSDVLVVSA